MDLIRFNIVPFCEEGNYMPSEFIEDLNEALQARTRMLNDGAVTVIIYDTQTGKFVE